MSQKTAKRNRQARRAPVRKPPTTSTGGGFLERVPRAWLYGGLAGIAVAVAVVLIVVNLTGGESKSSSPAAVDGSATAALLAGIPQDGISLGSPDAPVVLVEFADLQCPFCGEYAIDALPAIVEEYVRPGKVKLVFTGLAFIGPDSETALRATYAAGLQGKLWNYLDLLYRNQGPENSGWVTDGLLRAVGESIPGLDVGALMAARQSQEVDSAIAAMQQQARNARVDSTPTFFAGKTGGTLEQVAVSSLTADAFRPTLDALTK